MDLQWLHPPHQGPKDARKRQQFDKTGKSYSINFLRAIARAYKYPANCKCYKAETHGCLLQLVACFFFLFSLSYWHVCMEIYM